MQVYACVMLTFHTKYIVYADVYIHTVSMVVYTLCMYVHSLFYRQYSKSHLGKCPTSNLSSSVCR